MNFVEKYFKAAVLVLIALAIFVYGMANRYQFHYVNGSLTGFACDHYNGKCEWLSPEEMGKEKAKKYAEKQRMEMERQGGPQALTPDKPRQ